MYSLLGSAKLNGLDPESYPGRPGPSLCSTACVSGSEPRSRSNWLSQTRGRHSLRALTLACAHPLRRQWSARNRQQRRRKNVARRRARPQETSSSPAQTREENGLQPCTRCSVQPNSTASTPRAISTKSSNASRTTPSAGSTTCRSGTCPYKHTTGNLIADVSTRSYVDR
jgi:hypothetical protein